MGLAFDKKAAVMSQLTPCAHLLCKDCELKFAEEFGGASANLGHGKPLRGNCPLCGEYVKPALLDIKSGYSDDSAEDLP